MATTFNQEFTISNNDDQLLNLMRKRPEMIANIVKVTRQGIEHTLSLQVFKATRQKIPAEFFPVLRFKKSFPECRRPSPSEIPFYRVVNWFLLRNREAQRAD